MINITPLDAWIREKAGIARETSAREFVKRLEDYQLKLLNETIDYARRKTSFYRRHLNHLPTKPLNALSDLAGIPFTTPSDLVRDPFAFLAVRQDDVARTVTLFSSGTTGEAKRIFFTEGDLELAMDFFHHGVATFAHPGQKIMVLLPGERPDGVGNLLFRGLRRLGLDVLVYGPVVDPVDAAGAIVSFGADCIVGIPTQVLAVARSAAGRSVGKGRVKSIVLTADHVPRAIAQALETTWGCRVFNHYGMTETGLGGGFECESVAGYHLREADLFFEIVDPETGAVCPDGVAGEVVFSTLTRKGMPLIRYRTGDISRFIPESCPCGTALRRMECIQGRRDNIFHLGPGLSLTLAHIDEVLFRFSGILDFRAVISLASSEKFQLAIKVFAEDGNRPAVKEIIEALVGIDEIKSAVGKGYLKTPVVSFSREGRWATTGVAKRKLVTTGNFCA